MYKLSVLAFLLCTLTVWGFTDTIINRKYKSKNYDSRVRFLIYHFTAGDMHSSLVTLMGDGEREVSSHYLINDTLSDFFGDYIYSLVPEEDRAWQAGVSAWGLDAGLNSSSIGVEIVNRDGNKYQYPKEQIEQVLAIGKYLVTKYDIHPKHVLGHSDIAPSRKDDPGSLFPWKYLAEQGVGAWPNESDILKYKKEIAKVPDVGVYQKELSKYGYKIEQTKTFNQETVEVVRAFQRHFRPKYVSGLMDIETYIILKALHIKYN